MKTYSVLLLYPDYIADDFGTETYLTTVVGDSPEDAVGLAQDKCMEDNCDEGESAINAPEDLAVLLVCDGRIFDVWQR